MRADLRPALIASIVVHIGAAAGGLLVWADRPEPPRPPTVPVMLVSAPPGSTPLPTEMPEPAAAAAPDPPPAEPSPSAAEPEPPAPTPAPSPTPRTAAPAPRRPAPTTAATRPQPIAPQPARTPTVAKPPAAPPQPSLDLASLRNRLARNRPAAPAPAAVDAAGLQSAQAALGARLQELWRPNCEVEGGSKVNVRVRFDLGADGRVAGEPEVVGGLSSDSVTRAAQERAIRAVLAGQPYDWLPNEALGVSYAPRFNAEQACRG